MVANGLQFLDERASGPQQRVITWTPAMAEHAFTTLNTHERQRGFKQAHAEMLKRLMDNGEWREPWFQTWIAFELGSKAVVNGQHTLWAIWKHNRSVHVWTAWALDAMAISSFDNFKARSVSVLCQQAGMDNTTIRNAVTKLRMGIDEKHGSTVVVTVPDTFRITIDDDTMNACIAHIMAHPQRNELRSQACVAYSMWRIATVNGLDEAKRFVDSTATGANMDSADPRLHLMRFIRHRAIQTWNDRFTFIVGFLRAYNMWKVGDAIGIRGFAVKAGATMPGVVKAD